MSKFETRYMVYATSKDRSAGISLDWTDKVTAVISGDAFIREGWDVRIMEQTYEDDGDGYHDCGDDDE